MLPLPDGKGIAVDDGGGGGTGWVVGAVIVPTTTEGASTLFGIVTGAIGAACGAIGTYLARRYRIKSAAALTERQRLFAQYRRLVEELQEQVGELRREVMDIQRQYLESQVENAALKSRIVDLESHTQ
jgi:hypothetical protein